MWRNGTWQHDKTVGKLGSSLVSTLSRVSFSAGVISTVLLPDGETRYLDRNGGVYVRCADDSWCARCHELSLSACSVRNRIPHSGTGPNARNRCSESVRGCDNRRKWQLAIVGRRQVGARRERARLHQCERQRDRQRPRRRALGEFAPLCVLFKRDAFFSGSDRSPRDLSSITRYLVCACVLQRMCSAWSAAGN